MVLFGFIFFVSVAALLAVREMDIECDNLPKARANQGPARRAPQTSGFPAEPAGMRPI
jgi:hypothetical protein